LVAIEAEASGVEASPTARAKAIARADRLAKAPRCMWTPWWFGERPP
jgi:hypothetical protein